MTNINVQFVDQLPAHTGAVVLCAFEDFGLTSQAQKIDAGLKSQISTFVQEMDFNSKLGQTLNLAPLTWDVSTRLLIAGCGKKENLNETDAWQLGGHICKALRHIKQTQICLLLDDLNAEQIAAIVSGFKLRYWRFDKYKTKKVDDETSQLQDVMVVCQNPQAAEQIYADVSTVVEGSHLTRSLVSEPGNVLYPEVLAQHAKSLSDLGVQVEIFDEAKLKEMGMHALLGVGVGSEKESKLVIMRWMGAPDKTSQPIAFVGKGITFDTGGISIKPSKGMEDMKGDMGGAAVVIGLMKTLALRKAKVNVVGTIALAENMPSGTAQRPGDIVRSYSGQTIEILNTDAEGRLVLADALWYTQETYKPRFMLDLATLTGAIVIALGHEYAGLFSNNEELIEQLKTSSKLTGEKLWHMPLDDVFDKDIDSPVADVKNIGSYGAGSITAAQFLQRFVADTPWAHLDIAGVSWSAQDRTLAEKGATSFGVRLLDRFVRDYYEEKDRS